MEVQVANLIAKQQIELQSLRYRIYAGIEEQKKIRSKDLEKLLQKYQNVRQEIENKHMLEQQKYQKATQHKNKIVIIEPSTTSFSK